MTNWHVAAKIVAEHRLLPSDIWGTGFRCSCGLNFLDFEDYPVADEDEAHDIHADHVRILLAHQAKGE